MEFSEGRFRSQGEARSSFTGNVFKQKQSVVKSESAVRRSFLCAMTDLLAEFIRRALSSGGALVLWRRS
jgi:hypothetical protein